jgi:septum site-determining protein MinD
MTKRILVISGKGGVGKTTLVANLTYALTELGQKVIALDANPTTPNLGLHFGLYLTSKTLHNALKGEVKVRDIIYSHPFGFDVIPASLNIKDLEGADPTRLPEITLDLIGRADFVLMDCSAGLGRETLSALEACDEVILITNPDLPSIADALRALKLIELAGKKPLGVVLNRIKKERYELKKKDVEEILGLPVIAEIPEDKNVNVAIACKIPLFELYPNSPASLEIKRLAYFLLGKELRFKKPGILRRIINWLTK